MKKKICVVGGDLRQMTVYDLLKNDRYDVASAGLSEDGFDIDKLSNADVVILPIPVSYDNVHINAPLSKEKITISQVVDALKRDSFLLGACISDDIKKMLTEKGIAFYDYYEREELIIKNAIPTAEGTIEIALSEMPITLFESRVLVVGYGRVGEVLAGKLQALGADVTVSARKCSDFAWIKERGMKTVHTKHLAVCAKDFDLIVNTVPAMILDMDVLKNVRSDALIIDLASKPGGVDFEAAKELNKNVIWALSLPGKCAPITSGKIIKEAIVNILEETGV